MIWLLIYYYNYSASTYLTTRHNTSLSTHLSSNCTVYAIDGIAATTSGFDCIPRLRSEWDAVVGGSFDVVAINNCTIYKNGIPERCRFSRYVPGSNLYFACWACMLSSVAVALKWKAAKALKFAQSQAERQQQQQERDNHQGGEYGGGSGGVDDDDDYDDDDTR